MHGPRIESFVLVAIVALAVGLVVQTFRLAWQRSMPARRLAASRVRGARGEARAIPLLEGMGFAIEGEQVSARYELLVDGAPAAFDLRADFLVTKDGRRYVAEVKTGTYAPRIGTIATRRQLLEYGVAFDVDGVLLVDAETETVHLVEGLAPAREGRGRGGALVVGLLVGALLGASVAAWSGLGWPFGAAASSGARDDVRSPP